MPQWLLSTSMLSDIAAILLMVRLYVNKAGDLAPARTIGAARLFK